jgi:hypothetical protein
MYSTHITYDSKYNNHIIESVSIVGSMAEEVAPKASTVAEIKETLRFSFPQKSTFFIIYIAILSPDHGQQQEEGMASWPPRSASGGGSSFQEELYVPTPCILIDSPPCTRRDCSNCCVEGGSAGQ